METNLKELFNKKKYNRCISTLEDLITREFVLKIQEKCTNYEYTTILDMLDVSDKFFDKQTKWLFIQYFNLLHEDIDDEYMYIDYLLEIYKQVKGCVKTNKDI